MKISLFTFLFLLFSIPASAHYEHFSSIDHMLEHIQEHEREIQFLLQSPEKNSFLIQKKIKEIHIHIQQYQSWAEELKRRDQHPNFHIALFQLSHDLSLASQNNDLYGCLKLYDLFFHQINQFPARD